MDNWKVFPGKIYSSDQDICILKEFKWSITGRWDTDPHNVKGCTCVSRDLFSLKCLIVGVGETSQVSDKLCLSFAENGKNTVLKTCIFQTFSAEWMKYLFLFCFFEQKYSFCISKAHNNKAFLRTNLYFFYVVYLKACFENSILKYVLEVGMVNPAEELERDFFIHEL